MDCLIIAQATVFDAAQKVIVQLSSDVAKAALPVLGIFVLIRMLIMAGKIFLSGGDEMPNVRGEIYSAILFILALSIYPATVALFSSATSAIVSQFDVNAGKTPEQIEEHRKKVNSTGTSIMNSISKKNSTATDKSDASFSIFMTGEEISNALASLLITAVNWLCNLLISIARILLQLLSDTLSLILICLAPIAIVFGMVPGLDGKGTLTGFVGTFVAVNLWKAIMVLLDYVFTNITNVLVASMTTILGNGDEGDKWTFVLFAILLMIVFVALYIAIPFLTQLVIPSQGGAFMSSVMGGAMTAGVAAVGMAKGAQKAPGLARDGIKSAGRGMTNVKTEFDLMRMSGGSVRNYAAFTGDRVKSGMAKWWNSSSKDSSKDKK